MNTKNYREGSRRYKRFHRRKRKRELKKEAKIQQILSSYDEICSYSTLFKAFELCTRGVMWKEGVQRYYHDCLFEIHDAKEKLLNNEDVREGFVCFTLYEYGKKRNIKATKFSERVIQKGLCIRALLPVMLQNVVKGNSASQKDRGLSYAHELLTNQLQRYYRKYGYKGYALCTDFRHYFESLPHEQIKRLFREYFSDKNILWLCDLFVDAYGDMGLGLGAEISQILAIMYSDKLDHLIYETLGMYNYNRYMDDTTIIHHDKNVLMKVLAEMRKAADKYELVLHPKKTVIKDIHRGFTFLKTRYKLCPNGKVLRRPCRESIVRERRKLKKAMKLVKSGVCSYSDIMKGHISWQGSMGYRDSARSVYQMNKLLIDEISNLLRS